MSHIGLELNGQDMKKMKKATAAVSSLATCGFLAAGAAGVASESRSSVQGAAPDAYVSPYAIDFDIPLGELLAPDSLAPRNDVTLQSEVVPKEQWYSDATRRRYTTWGPPARTYPRLSNRGPLPLEWQQQRLLAVAAKYINLEYQHHHIPAWNPPANWPMREVPCGKNSPGLDCSNFTSWVYNYGLGIKFTSDVHKQAALPLQSVKTGPEYSSFGEMLRPGDLLFIHHKDKSEECSHVVMWLGKYGKSPDGTPLIIDCTASSNTDCNGKSIPTGVQIRPFTESSWYYTRFHHASRVLPGN